MKTKFYGNFETVMKYVKFSADIKWHIFWDDLGGYVCVPKTAIEKAVGMVGDPGGRWVATVDQYRDGVAWGYVEKIRTAGSNE